jgi:hypothetical protein
MIAGMEDDDAKSFGMKMVLPSVLSDIVVCCEGSIFWCDYKDEETPPECQVSALIMLMVV